MSDRAMGGGGEASTDDLAPVIPLFGARGARPERAPERKPQGGAGADADAWHTTWNEEIVTPSDAVPPAADELADDHRLEAAERLLLRRLRGRSLSVVEARAVVTQLDVEPHEIDGMLVDFARRGYLDDDALAEQLVHVGVDRKGQGRQVIAMTLASRGIPRDVADRALAAMPDDDAERALEFARSKARSMRSLDRETALRRLTGQLARRGYGGSVALTAARTALDTAE